MKHTIDGFTVQIINKFVTLLAGALEFFVGRCFNDQVFAILGADGWLPVKVSLAFVFINAVASRGDHSLGTITLYAIILGPNCSVFAVFSCGIYCLSAFVVFIDSIWTITDVIAEKPQWDAMRGITASSHAWGTLELLTTVCLIRFINLAISCFATISFAIASISLT